MKVVKIFECLCKNNFTGDFCEFKTEQNQLLYFNNEYMNAFDGDGLVLKASPNFDVDVGSDYSCATMLNGEVVIFGGWHMDKIARQVKNEK